MFEHNFKIFAKVVMAMNIVAYLHQFTAIKFNSLSQKESKYGNC